jgi:uncharacterized protein with HEPN domain
MRNEIILKKLRAYSKKVLNYCEGVSYAEFIADSKLVEACVFNLSQMGELCRAVEKAFADATPQIPWNEMYGLRNRIVHDYEGVNLLLVWQIITEDLQDLCTAVTELIGKPDTE